jgi:hypothetical protein
MLEVLIALGGLEPNHILLARIRHYELVGQINAFREVRSAVLTNCPDADPISEYDALMPSGCGGDPLRFCRVNGRRVRLTALGKNATPTL